MLYVYLITIKFTKYQTIYHLNTMKFPFLISSISIAIKIFVLGLEETGGCYLPTMNLKKFTNFQYLSNLTRDLHSIHLINSNECFINFTHDRLVYYNKQKFLGWKKDYFNIRVLDYHPETKTVFTQNDQKYFIISIFEN